MNKIYIIIFEILLCINTNSMYSLSLEDIIKFLQNNDTAINCSQPRQDGIFRHRCKIEKSKHIKDTLILTISAIYGSDFLKNFQIYLKYTFDGKDYKLNIID